MPPVPGAQNGASYIIKQVRGTRGLHLRMIYSDPAMCLNCATLVLVYAEI